MHCLQALSILDLPDEMIEKILTNMSFSDRSKARVNRRIAEIERRMKVVKETGDKWSEVSIKVRILAFLLDL